MSNVRGFDASLWQGTINFAGARKAGNRFVFLKATQGVGWIDPLFSNNWHKAHNAGLEVGGYHFLDNSGPGSEQAAHFATVLRTVGYKATDLPPVCDFEDGGHATPEMCREFNENVRDRLGRRMILYSGSTLRDSGGGRLGAAWLWIPDYGVSAPPVPEGWDTWTFWQYTSNGHTVPGESRIDADLFHGGPLAWRAWRYRSRR
jgi:lysozyme